MEIDVAPPREEPGMPSVVSDVEELLESPLDHFVLGYTPLLELSRSHRSLRPGSSSGRSGGTPGRDGLARQLVQIGSMSLREWPLATGRMGGHVRTSHRDDETDEDLSDLQR